MRPILLAILAGAILLAASHAAAGRWHLGDVVTVRDFNDVAARVGCPAAGMSSDARRVLAELVGCLVRRAGGSEDDADLLRGLLDPSTLERREP